MKPCFGRRWWHRRKREREERYLFAPMREWAKRFGGGDSVELSDKEEYKWKMRQPHVFYWHCPCAQEEERDG